MLFGDLLRLILGSGDLAPPTPARKPPVLARVDPPETLPAESDAEDDAPIDAVEGVAVTIEYESASGDLSRRRITMNRIERGAGAPVLLAYCHERRAPRKFRLDRIVEFIDPEGELLPPEKFWADLGVNLTNLERASARSRPGVEQRKAIRQQLYLLVALGRSDGRLADRELAAILDFVEASCHAKGVPCALEDVDALAEWLMLLYPTEHQLSMATARLEDIGDDASRRFWTAVERVVSADGVIDDGETRFLMEIRQALDEAPPRWFSRDSGE